MPEPHILLIVVAPAASGKSSADGGLPRRRLALPRRQHAAHQDFVDAVGRDPGPLDRGRNRARAERVRRRVLQVAKKAAHWRARRADDDDGVCGGHGIGLRCVEAACATSFSGTSWRATPQALI